MLQSTNPGYHCAHLYIRSSKFFFFLVSVLKLVVELQPFFDVVMTKEFTDNLCSVNMSPLSSTEVCMEDYYTLGSGEIHGKQIEPSFNFAHPCIGKL